MGRRENFVDTLNHKRPEKLIVDFGGNPLSCMEGKTEENLLSYLGMEKGDSPSLLFGAVKHIDERILRLFDTDTRAVGKILSPQDSQFKMLSDTEYIDCWGIKRRFTGQYWDICEYPLKGASIDDLSNYAWPDPDSIDEREIAGFAADAKFLYENTDYVICGEHPVYGIFELGCWMCGFEDFLIKMALDEDFVHKFFEIILNYQKKVIEKYYCAIGPYIHYTSSGDDYATQNAPFCSVSMFNDLIKPYFKERVAYTKKFTHAKYLHHSCGSVVKLIDDIIDCGVDILNPIQPKATGMAPENLKSKYGERIVFHGGFDTQEILPAASVSQIDEEVHKLIEIMGKDGGYIFAAAHNIQEDVPPQNIAAMFEAAKKYK